MITIEYATFCNDTVEVDTGLNSAFKSTFFNTLCAGRPKMIPSEITHVRYYTFMNLI